MISNLVQKQGFFLTAQISCSSAGPSMQSVHVTMDPGSFPSSHRAKYHVFESGLDVFFIYPANILRSGPMIYLRRRRNWAIPREKRPKVRFFSPAVGCTEHFTAIVFLRQSGNELIVPRNCTD